MAAERTLKITIVGDAKSAQGALKVVGDSTDKAAGKFGGLQTSMVALAAVAGGALTAGLLQLPGLLNGMMQGAAMDAQSVGRLEQAITNASGSFAPYAAQVDELIKKGQRLAFTDDQIRDSLALLTAQTGNVDEAVRRLALAQDLARGTGMDLGMASKLLGKVTEENINVLGRYGIQVEKGADAQALFNAVDQKFRGQAAKYAGGAAAQWGKVQDQVAETGEAFGSYLLPAMSTVVNFLSDSVAPAFRRFIDNIADFLPVVIGLAAGILTILVPSFLAWAAAAGTAAGATITAWTAALLPVLPVLVAVGAAVALLVAAWQNNWFGIRDTVTAVAGVVGGYLTGTLLPALRSLWSELGARAATLLPAFGALWTMLQPILLSIVAPFQSIVAQVRGVGGAMSGNTALMAQFAVLWDQLRVLWVQLQPVVTLLAQVLGAVLVVALGLLVGILSGLAGMLAGLLPGAIRAFTGALQVVGGIIQLVVGVIQIAIAAITGLVTGDWATANTQMTAISDTMRTAVIGIWDGLKNVVIGLVSGLVGGIIGLVDGLGSALLGYFGAIYTALTGQTAMTWQQIKDTIGASLTAAWEWIQATWNGAVTYLASVWGAITAAVTGAWNGLTTFLGTTLDGWRDFVMTKLTAVRDTFTSIFDAIGAFVMSALNGLRDYLYGRLDAIRSDFAAIWGLIQATVTALAETMVGKIILAIIDLGRTILDELGKTKDALGRLWDALVNFALLKVGELYDRVTEKIVQLRDYIADRINETLDGWRIIWTAISTFATDTWSGIKNFFVTTAAAMLAAIRGPFDDARDRVSEAWNTLKGSATDAWDAIKRYASDGLAAMRDAIKQPFEDARDLVTTAWTTLKTTATDTWDAIKTYAVNGLTAMQSAITAPFSAAKTAIQGVWEGIDLYINGPQGALATIQGRFDTAKDGLRAAVVKPFEDARDAIGGVMNAFGQNIVNSLRAAIGKVTSFGNGVRSIINWIADKLGAGTIVPTAPDPAIGSMPGYARGTDYHPGGWAIVGEQGPELVNLPRGASVIPNAASMALMSGAGVPGYALGVGDLWKFIRGGAEAALNAAVSATGFAAPALSGSAFAGWGGQMWDTVKGWIGTFIGDLFSRQKPAVGANGYAFPIVGWRGTVPVHWGSVRGGSDLFAPEGTPIVVMRGGNASVGSSSIGGYWASISGDDGLEYYYAHMQGPAQASGSVSTGQPLSAVGETGNAAGKGAHLHLGIGPAIIEGTGPTGGTGGDFDAVGLLQAALDATPMANGGIVNKPTVALLGEDGPEAVVPLGRGGGRSALRNYNVTVNNTVGMDERQLVNWLRRLELAYG